MCLKIKFNKAQIILYGKLKHRECGLQTEQSECACDYKKDSFSRGQWEEVEPSHRRKVAAQEMM